MLVIKRNKYLLKIEEVYFPKRLEQKKSNADIVIYFQVENKIIENNVNEFKTIHVNLTNDEESIFSELNKNTRYEIRRAEEKDKLDYFINSFPSDDDLNEFSDFFNIFAQNKDLPVCNKNKLKILRDSSSLALSVIKDRDHTCLCYHAYIVDRYRARFLYSASHFRGSDKNFQALIGRANRYLHWQDIKHFKNIGLSIYDLGGIGLDNIANFKRGFGGTEVIEYNYYEPQNILGKIALKYLRRKGQFD